MNAEELKVLKIQESLQKIVRENKTFPKANNPQIIEQIFRNIAYDICSGYFKKSILGQYDIHKECRYHLKEDPCIRFNCNEKKVVHVVFKSKCKDANRYDLTICTACGKITEI